MAAVHHARGEVRVARVVLVAGRNELQRVEKNQSTTVHLSPIQPFTHLHMNESRAMKLFVVESEHVPPCEQGLDAHSFTSVLHSLPEKPFTQEQAYLLIPSTQVPPFKQGYDAHSSRLMLQVSPPHPFEQVQLH